jgi:hypothetical protein
LVIPSLLQIGERLYTLKCNQSQLFCPALLVTPSGHTQPEFRLTALLAWT